MHLRRGYVSTIACAATRQARPQPAVRTALVWPFGGLRLRASVLMAPRCPGPHSNGPSRGMPDLHFTCISARILKNTQPTPRARTPGVTEPGPRTTERASGVQPGPSNAPGALPTRTRLGLCEKLGPVVTACSPFLALRCAFFQVGRLDPLRLCPAHENLENLDCRIAEPAPPVYCT